MSERDPIHGGLATERLVEPPGSRAGDASVPSDVDADVDVDHGGVAVDELPDTAAGEPSGRRRWPRIAAVVLVVLASYYVITLAQVWRVASSDQARPVDAIVVMGAAQYDGRPSPVLQARLDHVVDLWNQGLAPLVVVTGGKQPGDRFTEASASAAYLRDHGIDDGAILQEDHGRSSWESLSSAASQLRDHGASSVLLVSDPYHSLRIRLMAQELGLRAYVSPTRSSPVGGAAAFGKELKEAVGVSVGRIIGFDRLLSITG